MSTAQASASWCHDYQYETAPEFAGSGYKPGNEDFSGSVTEVIMYPDDGSHMVLFKGDTKGKGAKLQQTAPLKLWNEEYKLKIAFTMPKDLGKIGEWEGLLGNERGGNPYPYFSNTGFYYEKQNGPHPRKAKFGLALFKGGQSYVVQIAHADKNGGSCFSMSLFGKRRARCLCTSFMLTKKTHRA